MRAQVDGKLIAVNFVEGQDVKKGDVLGEIDPVIYQAQYDQAVAKKAQDEAQLANQRLDLARYQQLAATNAGSKQQADTQKAWSRSRRRWSKPIRPRSTMRAATLGYTKIIAPISGRAGLRQVDQGNIIHASDVTGLVILTQLQPIAVQFSLPQQQIVRVNAASAKGALAVDVFGNDGTTVIDTGTLKGIDNQVDPTTGTLKLKAEFPNANFQLWPGQFVNVRLKVETLPEGDRGADLGGSARSRRHVQLRDRRGRYRHRQTGRGDAAERTRCGDRQRPFDLRPRGDDRICQSVRRRQSFHRQGRSHAGRRSRAAQAQPRPDAKGDAKDGRRMVKPRTASARQAQARRGRPEGTDRAGDRRASRAARRSRSHDPNRRSQSHRLNPDFATTRTQAMSVSEPFIRRPIATSLLGIALLIGGALGYWALPVSALPQVDFPTVQVTTQLPGASPDVIASLITAPLERQLGQIPSLSSMNSTSSFGVSQISLQFDLNRDIDGATQDVQAAINAAAGILPKNLPYPPTYAKVNPADAPVMTLALTSETISLRAMSDLADTILGQRLSQISGVGRVTVLGGLKPAVRVQADLARLAAYGISMEDLRNAIAGANVSGPKGSLDGAQQSYTIAANDQIAAAEAYKPIIIAYRNGAPVTIGDVAIIVDGLENDRTGGWYQGTPAVIIDIQRQPGANVIEVVRQIRDEIPKMQRAIPAGVNLTIVSDRTVTIRASVRDVQFTLILSVVLVTLVVLLFLRSLRATLIAGVALPLSLITSFGIMYFAGFSLDNLSLMALTIGTGFVVDDAIVMIENIVRHMEDGESVMEASLKGASEIGFTVISLTVSLIAVFIPLLFMSGLVGRMFREFALTLTIAVVTSAIVSLTLTPMMCSRLLKHVGEEIAVPGLATVSRGIDRMVAFYHRTLLWVLQRQRATLLVTFATLALTLVTVCDRAERLLAAAGHRLHHRRDRGRAGCFLC